MFVYIINLKVARDERTLYIVFWVVSLIKLGGKKGEKGEKDEKRRKEGKRRKSSFQDLNSPVVWGGGAIFRGVCNFSRRIVTPPVGLVKYSRSRPKTVFKKDTSSRVSTILYPLPCNAPQPVLLIFSSFNLPTISSLKIYGYLLKFINPLTLGQIK